jgi:glycosyltransferase involved in cell wall biosynthesis
MACGCPVIVSDRGALPETAGPGALVSAPEPMPLARAIRRLVTERPLRERLVGEGHRRVESFSWNEAASRTGELYARLLEPAAASRRVG